MIISEDGKMLSHLLGSQVFTLDTNTRYLVSVLEENWGYFFLIQNCHQLYIPVFFYLFLDMDDRYFTGCEHR